MKKILIPIDFSKNSIRAIQYGQELFKYEKVKFYLMHAFSDEVYRKNYDGNQLDEMIMKTEKNALKNINEILKNIRTNPSNADHDYRLIAAFNSLIDETEKIVRIKDIDLVIMGTKGVSNNTKLTFGSNTIQVLRFIESPVLSVPNFDSIKAPKKILLLTDFMSSFKRRELELICELVHQFQIKTEVLTVSKKKTPSKIQEKYKKLINEVLCKIPLDFISIESNDTIGSIVNYISNNSYDLLVLANTKHTSLDKFLLPSVIDGVSSKVNLPILVLQNIRKD